MAWAEWKEVLLPGTQRDRHGNRFTFTRRDILQADRNVGRMLSRGVPIPCVWEHVGVEAGDTEARKAAYAKYTFGHIAGRRINDRGALELLHKGRDPKDREQLLKTRFVSPKVCPGYSDSRGGEYRGTTIAHVAATPTPVQFWQRPFGAVLSRRKALYLSYQPGGDAMADDPKKGDEGGAGGENAELTALIDALRAKGMNISDKVTNLRELTIAVESAGDVETDPDLGLDDDLDGAGTGATTAAGSGPMLMSDARAEPLRKHTRGELAARVKGLFSTGRIDKPTAADLLRQVKAVELSYTRAGELVPNRLALRVEVLEGLKPHAAWKPNGRVSDGVELSTTELGGPGAIAGDAAKAAEEAGNWLMGGYAAKK